MCVERRDKRTSFSRLVPVASTPVEHVLTSRRDRPAAVVYVYASIINDSGDATSLTRYGRKLAVVNQVTTKRSIDSWRGGGGTVGGHRVD